jgi:hypothetical protein
MKLTATAFGLAMGILTAAALFITAWWLYFLGAPTAGASFLEHVYPGFAYTPLGSVIGLGYGFVDGLIFGAVLAWLYNGLCAWLATSEPTHGITHSSPAE